MEDFDKDSFESQMTEADLHYIHGEYSEAIPILNHVYSLAPKPSLESGRVARNLSANYAHYSPNGREPNFGLSAMWATSAYSQHSRILNDMESPTREIYRECSTSAMSLSISGIRKYIKGDFSLHTVPSSKLETLNLARTAWSDIQISKELGRASGIEDRVDQYEINIASKASVVESLIGDKKRGREIGMLAVRSSIWSESPSLTTAKAEMTPEDRRKAKIKAFGGGVLALSVWALAKIRANSLAKKLAPKALGF